MSGAIQSSSANKTSQEWWTSATLGVAVLLGGIAQTSSPGSGDALPDPLRPNPETQFDTNCDTLIAKPLNGSAPVTTPNHVNVSKEIIPRTTLEGSPRSSICFNHPLSSLEQVPPQPFILMGGGSFNREVASLLARWANLRSGPVLICAWGSSIPDTYILDAQSELTESGAHEIISLPDYENLVATAENPSAMAVGMLNRASAIFFAGGDQTTLFRRLRALGLDSEITKRIEQDSLIVAGTSAGTAIASKFMIAGKTRDAELSDSFYSRQLNHSYTHEGSGWLPQIVFDQHFSQRNRLPRLIEALHAAPDEARYGIGVDERTAAVIIGGRYVYPLGDHTVTIINRESLNHQSPPWRLTAHQLFDLHTATPLEPSLSKGQENLSLVAER